MLTRSEIYVQNLSQLYVDSHRFYMTREMAYESLKIHTNQDFGYDVQSWAIWLIDNKFSVFFREYDHIYDFSGRYPDAPYRHERSDYLIIDT